MGYSAPELSRPAEPVSSAASSRKSRRLTLAASRAVCHAAAWAPFVLAAGFLLRRGWQPVADGAAITIRSWDVLSAHGPLAGQATELAHGVFDPGPLEYWLLSIPVHLDPAHGSLWGGALWCMIAASLAIEAAWAAGGRLGGLVASGTVLAITAWMPGITLQPYWNPWFGVMFLLVAVPAAWAAMCGHRGWWPVLVVAASIAAQGHLLFALSSVALVVVAAVAGLAESRAQAGRYRWLLAGLLAGAVCWSAPFAQQVFGARGNLLALLRAEGTPGRKTGLAFGLKALADAAGPRPLWRTPLQSLLDVRVIGQGSAPLGVAILVVLIIVAVAAIRPLRSRRLAALAGVALVLDLGALAAYSSIAVSSIPNDPGPLANLNYLMILLLPVAAVTWLTVAAALVTVGRMVLGRTAVSGRAPGPAVALAAMVVVLAAGAVAPVLAMTSTWLQFPGAADLPVVRLTTTSFQQIERRLPHGPVALSVATRDPSFHPRRLLLSLTLALRAHGYTPELGEPGWELGQAYTAPGHGLPRARVLVTRGHADVTIATRP
ncbi:MAG: hypothetical protein FWE35_29390 [Streptosporangiales bacterium]|nr:hypothetical protein [Streptosporangiales bacterium]